MFVPFGAGKSGTVRLQWGDLWGDKRHRSKSGDSSLHTRAGLSRGTQCSGSDCPVTQGRASARGLVQRRRGRITEQREPVVDPLSGQTLMGAGPLVPSPAPCAQIEPGAEQVEKALSGALVDVEIGAQCRIEPLDGTRGAMALVQHLLDGIEQRCARRATEPVNDFETLAIAIY